MCDCGGGEVGRERERGGERGGEKEHKGKRERGDGVCVR